MRVSWVRWLVVSAEPATSRCARLRAWFGFVVAKASQIDLTEIGGVGQRAGVSVKIAGDYVRHHDVEHRGRYDPEIYLMMVVWGVGLSDGL
jgi:hypothetical protein